jgi:hypothetical protein
VYLRIALGALALTLAGCEDTVRGTDGAPPPEDGGAYVRCSALCLRPGDCAIAYPSGGEYCPLGFLCSLTFSCNDGGP